jgi:hypothetical protein
MHTIGIDSNASLDAINAAQHAFAAGERISLSDLSTHNRHYRDARKQEKREFAARQKAERERKAQEEFVTAQIVGNLAMEEWEADAIYEIIHRYGDKPYSLVVGRNGGTVYGAVSDADTAATSWTDLEGREVLVGDTIIEVEDEDGWRSWFHQDSVLLVNPRPVEQMVRS